MQNHEDVFQTVPFRIGKERFSVDISEVHDFHEAERVRTGRNAVDGTIGMLERRGVQIPVYPLGRRLGISGSSLLGNVVMVMKGSGQPQGLAVDAVDQPVEVRRADFHPFAKIVDPSNSGAIDGVIVHGGKILLHLNPKRLISASEAVSQPIISIQPKKQRHLPTARSSSSSIFAFVLAAITPDNRDILFAVSGRQVLEIIEEGEIISIPSAPRFVAGLILWRNRPVPVVDLGTILGWDPLPQEKRNILIVRAAASAETVALAISGTARTISLPIRHRLLTDEEIDQSVPQLKPISSAIFDVRGRILGLVDLDYILGEMTGSTKVV